ncbi:hypothetical protein [Desulfuribacillus stibiiarsenatis]|uniref:hypothetical protein n=1 Tax=Desulfuribacillus stibiiarsenatis TaxID=1390249 RepID=UPI0015B45953|nr:hypothetical protein [Desulfuribacillus stibiiarsenatis]
MLKDEIKKAIDDMPEDCSIEDIQYTLYVQTKVRKGLKDLDEGRYVTQDEMEQRFSK